MTVCWKALQPPHGRYRGGFRDLVFVRGRPLLYRALLVSSLDQNGLWVLWPGPWNQPSLSVSWYFSPLLTSLNLILGQVTVFHCSSPGVCTVGFSGLSGATSGRKAAGRGGARPRVLWVWAPLHLITLFVKVLGFYPVICSSNIQLKLHMENHLHTVDHGITSFLHPFHVRSRFQYEAVLSQSFQQLRPRLGLLLGVTA